MRRSAHSMQVRFKKLDPRAADLEYAHDGDAGFDFRCLEGFTLEPGERRSVGTGLAIELPDGYVSLIWEKSGLAFNHGIKTFGGVVDSGYRGEYKVGLINVSDEPYTFAAGDKVAQVLIQKVERATFVQVDELSDSARGADGFGSTGK